MRCTPLEIARLLGGRADARAHSDDIVIVAAHPDDEIASAGSILPFLRDRVRILHVTSGAPDLLDEARAHGFSTPDEYALAREREFAAVAVKLRLPISAHRSLGFIDQDGFGGEFQALTFVGSQPATECHLDEAAQDDKAALVACYVTQRHVLERFPIDVERYRQAPLYDFSARPHDGDLLYERHDWGTSWFDWLAAVGRMLRVGRGTTSTS